MTAVSTEKMHRFFQWIRKFSNGCPADQIQFVKKEWVFDSFSLDMKKKATWSRWGGTETNTNGLLPEEDLSGTPENRFVRIWKT